MNNIEIFVEGGDALVEDYFRQLGFGISKFPFGENVGAVVFTGGCDVSPICYGQTSHMKTMFDIKRDQSCFNLYDGLSKDVLKIGICRGAQFLNVVNGGLLWQDVDNHTKPHKAYVTHKTTTEDDDPIEVTSTHHQMMIPHPDALILLQSVETDKRIFWGDYDDVFTKDYVENLFDIECLRYEDTNSLCFQPHPEYTTASKECKKFFEDCVDFLI